MLRRIVTIVVLAPLAVIVIAFAVANRQVVMVSFDPFSAHEPAAAITLPLFALLILTLITGVLIGGLAVWLRQGRWRGAARRLERELQHLRGKLAALEGAATEPTIVPDQGNPPPRLRPPVR
ncbi:MAG TPA: LapA family protein [Xanthobacteraceae bacterium]|nr:LapA family protein [Xanthobacteraceae bacterium]